MNYCELLKSKAEEVNSIVCVGLDPVLEEIPIKGDPGEVIMKFYLDMLEAFIDEDVIPGAVKPNMAFYEQFGIEGLKALKTIVETYKAKGIILISDAKRGDIGKTSNAYAKAIYDYWGFDSVTVAPYMGKDSVGPFVDYCDKGKGLYILNRTSNPGAVDLQNLEVDGTPVYMKVAEKIVEWAKPGTGAVVGATYPKELGKICELFVKSGKQIPLLIPGVGSQGGSAQEVMNVLKEVGFDSSIVRINSSSGINYAYKKRGSDDYAGAAAKALKELNKEIGFG